MNAFECGREVTRIHVGWINHAVINVQDRLEGGA